MTLFFRDSIVLVIFFARIRLVCFYFQIAYSPIRTHLVQDVPLLNRPVKKMSSKDRMKGVANETDGNTPVCVTRADIMSGVSHVDDFNCHGVSLGLFRYSFK